MAFTNKTPNYDLPQWIGSDHPTFLTDMNGAFLDIDTNMKANSVLATSANSTAESASNNASSAIETANNATASAEQANTMADNALTIANNANAQSGVALNKASEALDSVDILKNVTNWKKYMLNLSTDLSVIRPLVVGAQTPYSNAMFLIYNEKLKIMEIAVSVDLITPVPAATSINLTTYIPITGAGSNPARFFPVVKLPFSCTGSLIIGTFSCFKIQSSTAFPLPRYYGWGIYPYNGSAWLGIIANATSEAFDVTPTIKGEEITSLSLAFEPFWLQVDSLGDIVLNGWQDSVKAVDAVAYYSI